LLDLLRCGFSDRLNIMRTVALYARVSTKGQTLDNQLAELRTACERNGWHVGRVFTDFGISGAKGRGARRGLDDLLKAVVRREVDQVCVWSIDRLGRSLQDLIGVLDELQQKGCELYIHKQAIDTNTPSGKLLFQMLGVFAEFEREIIRERIIAGQQRARSQGKRIGRRTVLDETVLARAQRLRAEGLSVRQIARTLKLGIGTTCKALAHARSETVSV
jgi:DNA invertase Pin-like site-specific DNA recombinase